MRFDLRSRGRRRTVQSVYLGFAMLMGGGLVLSGVGTGSGVGGLLNAFTNYTVLHAWGNFFSQPWHAINIAWDTAISAYIALFEGAICQS